MERTTCHSKLRVARLTNTGFHSHLLSKNETLEPRVLVYPKPYIVRDQPMSVFSIFSMYQAAEATLVFTEEDAH